MFGHAIELVDGSQRPRTKGTSGVGGSSPKTRIAPSMIRSGVSPALSSPCCCGDFSAGVLPLHRSLTSLEDLPPPPRLEFLAPGGD